MKRTLLVLAAAAASALVVTRHDAALACPSANRQVAARPGPPDRLISRGAREVLVCRYDGATRSATAAARVDVVARPFPHGPREEQPFGNRLVDRLAEIRPQPPGMRGRPVCLQHDDGSRWVVLARYDDHVEVGVIPRSGCRGASNGTFETRVGTPRLNAVLSDAIAYGG